MKCHSTLFVTLTISSMLAVPFITAAQKQTAPQTKAENTDSGDVLSGKKFDRLITIKKTDTIDNLLVQIEKLSSIPLDVEFEEIAAVKVSCRYTAVPVRSLLKSLVALGEWKWEKRDKTYFLVEKHPDRELDALRPKNENEAVISDGGRKLMEQMKQLSPEMQQRLTDKPDLEKSLMLIDLPQEMQETVKAMVNAYIEKNEEKGFPNVIATSDFNKMRVSIGEGGGAAKYRNYHLGIGVENRYSSMSFPVFKNPQASHHTTASDGSNIWRPDADFKAQKEAAKAHDPKLSQKVHFKMESKSINPALDILSEQVGLNYVAMCWEAKPDTKRSFTFVLTPIGEALDKICDAYVFPWFEKRIKYDWTSTKEGVCVLRYYQLPESPAK